MGIVDLLQGEWDIIFYNASVRLYQMATTITAILLLMYGLIESLVPFMLMRFLDFLQRSLHSMGNR